MKRQWVEFWVPDAAHPPTGCHTGPLLKSSGPVKSYELTPPKEVAKNLEFPLSLASHCSDQLTRPWSVGNPNGREIVFAWHLAGTNQYGLDLVRRATPPDPGVKFFSTVPVNVPDTLSVYANGYLQASKTSASEPCNIPPQVEPPAEIFPIVADTDPRCTADAQPVLFQCGMIIRPIPILSPTPIDTPIDIIIPKKPIKVLTEGGAE